MSSNVTRKDLEEFTPSGSGLFTLILFGWMFSAIFNKSDTNHTVYTILMILGSLYTIKFIVELRQRKINAGVHYAYLLFWLGITNFTEFSTTWDSNYLTLYILEYIAITPTLIHWLIPMQKDTFFGLRKLGEEDKIKWLWKIAIGLLFLINALDSTNNLSTSFEFLILIPLVLEPILLSKMDTSEPMLTIFFQEELVKKFAIPISLLRSVSIILVAYLFEFLTSKFWVLIILLFFAWGGIWAIASTAKNFSTKGTNEFDIKDLRTMFEEGVINKEQFEEFEEKLENIQALTKLEESKNVESALITVDGQRTEIKKGSSAFQLGQKFRRELRKPKYNLAHILSTLSTDTFANGFKVPKSGMTFDSKQGQWEPPKGIILFPVDLGKYDFRRAGEMLLIGFNSPESYRGGPRSVISGNTGENSLIISSGSIKYGDTKFNMRTLVLSKNQWNEMSTKLDIVGPKEDISFTGFTDIIALQSFLGTLSDKWLEVRKKIQETAVSFIAGLLGVDEPVFSDIKLLEHEDIETEPKYDYEIVEEEE